jgi:hypothetical protein
MNLRFRGGYEQIEIASRTLKPRTHVVLLFGLRVILNITALVPFSFYVLGRTDHHTLRWYPFTFPLH